LARIGERPQRLLGPRHGLRGVPFFAELEEETGADLLVVLDDQETRHAARVSEE
jgi:hypothetical protein